MVQWSLDNTIFAPATAPQNGHRAVIRISGPQTTSVLGRVFCPDGADGLSRIDRRAISGTLRLGDDEQDVSVRAWLWLFSGPDSYTGEDLAELHVPGAAPLVRLVEQKLLALGLVPAERGEFTARAVLHGKLELTQAEAVNAMVRAENDAQLQAALNQLKGRLGDDLTDAYDDLAELVSLVEANIDFSEEDIQLIALDDVGRRTMQLLARIDDLIEHAVDTEMLATLPSVFLVGPANAGKSSLLNALTGVERAICSAIPGTTRDVISAVWRNDRREVLLVDCAGRVNPGADNLAILAVEHAEKYLPLADLFLCVFDLSADVDEQIDVQHLSAEKTIIVLNKTDLVDSSRRDRMRRIVASRFGEPVVTSARTGEGLADLTAAVFDRLSDGCLAFAWEELALNRRQRHALHRAADALRRTSGDLTKLATESGQFGYEIIAADLREALSALAELLGKDVSEHVLDRIFSEFCIGK